MNGPTGGRTIKKSSDILYTKEAAMLSIRKKKQIVLVNPQHSYGGRLVYLPGSVVGIAAVLMAMGHSVKVVDLNIDRLGDALVAAAIRAADLIGISLTGAPYIPEMLRLIPRMRRLTQAPIMLGGQVVERLTPEQFERIFHGHSNVAQIASNTDLASVLGCDESQIHSAYAVPFQPVFEAMGEERVGAYLAKEMTLVVSQGCHFKCAFCAARKGESEQFRAALHFETDVRYLAEVAKKKGVNEIRFYASSLDFFQNPAQVMEFLATLARVQEETGVRFQVRCLSCLTSFVKASERIPEFGVLLERAGLWCVGFGSDGTDEQVWKAEKKPQNTLAKLVECIVLTHELGVRAEILMVLGFPEETWETLNKTLETSRWITRMWSHTLIRPYLAKPFVPGNDGWVKDEGAVAQVVEHPYLFYNLDFAALGSKLTHPNRWHRFLSNFAYLRLCALTLTGRGSTSPILPQGAGGILGWIAQVINRLMPFDR